MDNLKIVLGGIVRLPINCDNIIDYLKYTYALILVIY